MYTCKVCGVQTAGRRRYCDEHHPRLQELEREAERRRTDPEYRARKNKRAREYVAARKARDPEFLRRRNDSVIRYIRRRLQEPEYRARVNAQANARNKQRMETDPSFARHRRDRNAVSGAVRQGATVIEVISVLDVFEAQGGRCAAPWCSAVLDRERYRTWHLDHITPISKGGQHVRGNVQVLCASCNIRKGDRHPEEWLASGGA